MTNAFLISAPQSGSGKTTVALAIMAALCRRGLSVAPFKCGPDFIDPGYHRLVTGRPSINLDGWMCPETFVAETFRLHAAGADVAVIEGAMGLFDGLGASSSQGSSAQVAAITGSPVVLVLNARGMAASAAAMVKGFAEYDPRVRLAGVIFNNVGSAAHGMLLKQALSDVLPQVAIGCLPRDEFLAIPARHLGLVTAEDNPLPPEYLERLADLAEQHLDLEALLGLEANPSQSPLIKGGDVFPPLHEGEGWGEGEVRIAVARDNAFCFVYEDNLRLLREAGAEIVAFSPLDDRELPPDLDGIYLPGGYPELYAERLSTNVAMRSAILAAVESYMPVYAECGGFIYLTEGMEAMESGASADFVGIFPVRVRMLSKRKALGYRQVAFETDSVIAAAGGSARGHEFHYSEIGEMPLQLERCYRVTRQGLELGREGYRFRNCLASYIHLHFGSHAGIAESFVAACRRAYHET
ncbi:MAG: cobyrinic acid a,c-diamide synthase [Desulfuromonadales bacterium GWD2_54_10]|nr:MAG: cobyrinic acid a,c-diamide synthase [Desulfuromonadales bacterium GWD2_54_10]